MAGFGLNLKLVLYLQSQCLTESLGFLNPPHRQAAKRYQQFLFKIENIFENKFKNLQMIEPIIGFSLFFLFVVFIIKTANKNREKQYEKLIEGIKEETELYIEQTKTSTMTIGLKNRDYLFNRCDLYLVKDALIILGFTKNSLIKQLSLPIILTSEQSKFSNRFPFAYVKPINRINFEENIVKINFGEKGITKTEVVLKLKSLKLEEIIKIRELALKNSW